MRVGIPKEIKTQEYRVGLMPSQVAELVAMGHQVAVQKSAGTAIGFSDEAYAQAGAQLLETLEAIFEFGELIVKVKEPQPQECALMREGQCVFCYYHLAASASLAAALQKSDAICLAYETVTDAEGRLPLLKPMSEVAGRMAVQAGVTQLTNPCGGRGILLGGVSGVAAAKVVIIGAGVVGTQAARVALGLGGDVLVLDKNPQALARLVTEFNGAVDTRVADAKVLEDAVVDADLVVGAVLVSGATAPKILTAAMLEKMRPGSVVVDVAIDQGGCFETSRPTTHDNPTYVVNGVIHYCVANIPGAVARTATEALTHMTFPEVKKLASQGVIAALIADKHLRAGLNVCAGEITHSAAAQSLELPYCEPLPLLEQLSKSA